MQYLQKDFVGGMNVEYDPTKIGANEYPLLFNGRTRYNVVQPIKSPLQITEGIPSGTMQGLYGVGSVLVLFVDGLAYYCEFSTAPERDPTFNQIADFVMSSTVSQLYCAVVPASTTNYKRKLVDSTRISGAVNFTSIGAGSPQCAVVQDGENQPWLIFPDATARQSGGYDGWSQDNREYVPIGKHMVYVDGILYIAGYDNIASSTRKLNQIFRSVSGRPTDFMVNIDINGNKPTVAEADGGAPCVSNKVDMDDITMLGVVASGSGSILVSTLKNSYFMTPDVNNTIFGEPQFINQYLFPYGATNNFSVVDILGDQAIIGQVGIRSFNAVKQLQNEGNNAPFSAKVQRLFEGITQNVTCATNFDDYAMFSVNTIFGPGVLVYDTVRSAWVGLDRYRNVGTIKQFAQIKVEGVRRLFFITTDNELFEAFASDSIETARMYIGEWSNESPFVEQKPVNFSASVSEVETAGSFQVTAFVDRQEDIKFYKDLEASYAVTKPSSIPFPYQAEDSIKYLAFNLQNAKHGQRLGFLIEFDAQLKLNAVTVTSDESVRDISVQQQADERYNYDELQSRAKSVYKVAAISNLGPGGDNLVTDTTAIVGLNPVTLTAGTYYAFLGNNTSSFSYLDASGTLQSSSSNGWFTTNGWVGYISTSIAPTFEVYGRTVQEELLRLIDEEEPDLVVCLGNLIMADSTYLPGGDIPTAMQGWRDRGIFHFVMGNLELDTDSGAPSVQYWQNPNNGRYYKVTHDGIDMFFLSCDFNTNAMSISHINGVAYGPPIGDNSENGEQALWLKNELENSTARFKLVFIHLPPYSSSEELYPGYFTLRWPFKKWGATAVISGEGRHYERFDVNSFPFINTGAGGLGMYNGDSSIFWNKYTGKDFVTPTTSGSEVQYNAKWGYSLFEISRFGFRHTFKTIDGDLIDPHTFNV